MNLDKGDVCWKFLVALLVIILLGGYYFLKNIEDTQTSTTNEKILEDKINDLNKSLTTERNIRLAIDSRLDSLNRVSQGLITTRDSISKEIKRIRGKYDKYTPSELEKLAEEKYQQRK